jgi:predicted RNA-binding protein YlqC (UPF0109 family)
MQELDREFVEYVAKALVTKPEAVEVKRSVDDMGVLLELTVDAEDMGKIIGRAGATAKSIRTLLRVLGAKSDERVNLKIIEPDGGEVRVSDTRDDYDAPAEEMVEEEHQQPDEHQQLVEDTKQEFADLDDLDL